MEGTNQKRKKKYYFIKNLSYSSFFNNLLKIFTESPLLNFRFNSGIFLIVEKKTPNKKQNILIS